MFMMVGEVSEKVNFIQDSLSDLDCQLGQLQDLSALAVDTLTLLSASDSLHQEEARLAQCRVLTASQHVLPHSWTLPHRQRADSDLPNMRRLMAKSCKSTPPSLLKGYTLATSKLASQERHADTSKSFGGSHGLTDEEKDTAKESAAVDLPTDNWMEVGRPTSHSSLFHSYGGGVHFSGVRDQTPCESCEPSRCGSPLSPRGLESPHHKLWTRDPYLYPSQEETSMEEGEEEEEEEEEEDEVAGEEESAQSNIDVCRTSSNTFLLSDPRDISGGLINPAFSPDDGEPSSRSRYSSQWRRPGESSRELYKSRDLPYGYCRSLSSSMENMTFSGAPLSPMRGSFPSLDEGGRNSEDNKSLQSSKSLEWSKSSDFTQVLDSRVKGQSRKTVKIQESHLDNVSKAVQSHVSDMSWRRRQKLKGEPTCWSASTSLSQLNFEPTSLLPKQLTVPQEMWTPTHSAWNSWVMSMSRRSSLQSGIAPEAKSSSFQSTDNLYPHYSAVERNNLMRLAHTIPFTPVSILGGEEVSVYSLEEVPSDSNPGSSSVSSWSSRGQSAMLQPLSSEEGSLDGGLRRGCRMLCTWAEQEVLKPGHVYVVKAFKPEVVRAWQKYFHGSTALQLCLREIQQQRAAQKMMQVFNMIKPDDMHHSPRFLDVSLVLWHSNGQWMTIERNMSGDFRKYNNNTGEEITPCCSLEEMLLAFSHWTYEYSCKDMLVLDIQGVGEILTDPTVIMADDQSRSRGEMLFGADNLGDAAITGFRQKHSCSVSCRRLGLTDFSNKSNQIIHAGCTDSSQAYLRKHVDSHEIDTEAESTLGKQEEDDETKI